jgi:hypothetical protein
MARKPEMVKARGEHGDGAGLMGKAKRDWYGEQKRPDAERGL